MTLPETVSAPAHSARTTTTTAPAKARRNKRPLGAPVAQAGEIVSASRVRRVLTRQGPGVALLAVVLLAWEFVPGWLDVEEFVFPPLHAVLENFTDSTRIGLIWDNWLVTMREAGLGLVIGVLAGVIMGFMLAEWPLLERLVYPYVVAIQALPKVAIAPLFVIWFGFGDVPKVLIAALLVFFPILINTMTAVASVDPGRKDLFASMVANRWQVWSQLLFPTAMPNIFAGIEMVVVFAILGAIVGEFISAQEGLGVLLQTMQNNYDTAGVFAVLIVLVITGVLANAVVRLVRNRFVFWH